MYERFTDRARKVMQLANHEAQRFNHKYIGTEHILLGLVKDGSGVAANVLQNLDINLRKVRIEVEKIVESGPDMVTMGKLPQTARTKKVIEYAIEEACSLNHNYVGTEHLLLGLIRENEGVASQVLINLGLSLEDLRKETLKLLGHPGNRMEGEPTHGAEPVTPFTTVRSASKALDTVFNFLQEKKEAAVAKGDFELAARLRDLTDELKKRINVRAPHGMGPKASWIKECDFYIPLHDKDGAAVEAEHLARVRKHLTDEFGGCLFSALLPTSAKIPKIIGS